MKKIESFNHIPGLIGKVSKDNKLFVTASSHILTQLVNQLTIKDNSKDYRIKQIKKSMSYKHTLALEEELNELEKNLHITYYKKIKDDLYEIPMGLWYLCEKIVGNSHKNYELKYLDFPKGEIQPREYQIESVKSLIKYKRAMLELATGLGKTIILIHLAHIFVQQGKRVCIIVPTIELTKQTVNALRKYYPDASGLGGNFKYKNNCPILVSTINSARYYVDSFDCVLIDETHHSASGMYNELVENASNAQVIYGMTASPCRADGLILGVHANCGPVVYRRDAKWGVDNNFLCQSDIYMLHIDSGKKINTKARYYNNAKAYKQLVTSDPVIDNISEYVKKCLDKGLNILVLFKTVEPSKQFAEKLSEKMGLKIYSASSSFRTPLLKFQNNESNVLIANAPLCGEGIDIPKIDVIFNLTNSKSESIVRQILGRGLRKSEGKKKLLFFDVVIKGEGELKYHDPLDKTTAYWYDKNTNGSYFRYKIYSEISEVKKLER